MQKPNSDSEQPQATHLVVHLDQELVVQALCECLQLAENLHHSPQSCREIGLQLRLRLSYALLHGEHPDFKRAEVRRLGLYHSQLATSLLRAQRLQACLDKIPEFLKS